MANVPETPELVRVWKALADHFLDTETRQDIPHAALCCLQAGLTIDQARDIWCYEVTPVVGANLWIVAGEWAAWDEPWLLEHIRKVRARRRWKPSLLSCLLYRATIHFGHGTWLAIARCMTVLMEAPPEAREPLAGELGALSRHYFDFCPPKAEPGHPFTRALRDTLFEILAPATMPEEITNARNRVDLALAEATVTTPEEAARG